MFNKNSVFRMVATSALCILICGCGSRSNSGNKAIDELLERLEKPVTSVELLDEESGLLYQQVTRHPATNALMHVERAYRSGRVLVFDFAADGSVASATAYSGSDKRSRTYQSFYFTNGTLRNATMYSPEGNLLWTFKREENGAEVRQSYRDGLLAITSVQRADGAATTTEHAPDGSVLSSKKVDATVTEEKQTLPDGKHQVVYSRKGVSLLGWKLETVEGELIHTITRVGSDLVVETPVDPENGTVLTQVWQCFAEDWNRKFYRLKSVEMISFADKSRMVWQLTPGGQLDKIQYYQDGKLKFEDEPGEGIDASRNLEAIEGVGEAANDMTDYALSEPGWEIELPGLYQLTGTPFLEEPQSGAPESLTPLQKK
ncbi:MAG: hypothetical protein K2W95_32265 [Candidatus Obscuribacterales bacterium]|nr:hypothetical protein [Candidatus Obscuribacterales bacterium]